MTDIGKICGIIDLSGSLVNGTFITREFGCVGMGRRYQVPESFLFDYKPYMIDMADMKVSSHKKKTKYRPELKFYDVNDLDDHVVRFYQAVKTKEKNIVGFKGGHCEWDLLVDLDIPHVNIEEMGCPRYEDLSCERFDRLACPYHRNNGYHCPKAEVAAFKYWLLENC